MSRQSPDQPWVINTAPHILRSLSVFKQRTASTAQPLAAALLTRILIAAISATDPISNLLVLERQPLRDHFFVISKIRIGARVAHRRSQKSANDGLVKFPAPAPQPARVLRSCDRSACELGEVAMTAAR